MRQQVTKRLTCARWMLTWAALSAAMGIGPPAAWAGTEPEAPSHAEQRTFGSSGDPVIDARAQNLGHKLRCPVCQGMPINESPATMAVDMMQQVRKMLRQGQSDADILAYFTSRYGQWVLLEPPHEGFALWIWIMPPICGVALLLFAWRIVWRLRHATGDSPMRAESADLAPRRAEPHVLKPAEADEAQALLAAIRHEVDLS